MYSCGPPAYGQLEHTYSSYVMIRDVILKTCQRRWMIGRRGERGSGISVLATRHDDDDNDSNLNPKYWMVNFIIKWRIFKIEKWFNNYISYTGWNDKIVTLEKTTWFHFRLMKTVFLFLLQTIYKLASCV